MKVATHFQPAVASISDLRALAARRLPRSIFDFLEGGAGDERTVRRNRSAFDDVLLQPEILAGAADRDLSVSIFGQTQAMPIIIGPTGLNGAYWGRGDICLGRAAKALGIPFVLSSPANVSLQEYCDAVGGLEWFQLYMIRDRGLVREFLARLEARGARVLELTADLPVTGRRNRDIRNGFTHSFHWSARNVVDIALHPRWALDMLRFGRPSLRIMQEMFGPLPDGVSMPQMLKRQSNSGLSWADLTWLRDCWPGKLILKGVTTPQQIAQARRVGVDGVVVSNHGGRQLDAGSSTIELLPRLADACVEELTLLIDGGFRNGTDVAKAIALGAHGVQLGRATLYGLAAAGQAGVCLALDIIRSELDNVMAQCGVSHVHDLRGKAHVSSPNAARIALPCSESSASSAPPHKHLSRSI